MGHSCVHSASIDFSQSPAKSLQTPLQNGERKKLNIAVAVSVTVVHVDTCCHSSWHGQNAHGKRPPLARQLLTLATHTNTLAQGQTGEGRGEPWKHCKTLATTATRNVNAGWQTTNNLGKIKFKLVAYEAKGNEKKFEIRNPKFRTKYLNK